MRNVTQYHLTDVTLTWRTNVIPEYDNLSKFKYMISGYQPRRVDNQRPGNTLSHMQNLCYILNSHIRPDMTEKLLTGTLSLNTNK